MNFYRLAESVDRKEIGIFPQRGEMIGDVNVQDPRHLFNQIPFERMKNDVFIPSFQLRKTAKATDMISLRLNTSLIVSKRFISILTSLGTNDFKLPP